MREGFLMGLCNCMYGESLCRGGRRDSRGEERKGEERKRKEIGRDFYLAGNHSIAHTGRVAMTLIDRRHKMHIRLHHNRRLVRPPSFLPLHLVLLHPCPLAEIGVGVAEFRAGDMGAAFLDAVLEEAVVGPVEGAEEVEVGTGDGMSEAGNEEGG